MFQLCKQENVCSDHGTWESEGEPEATRRRYEYYIYTDIHRRSVRFRERLVNAQVAENIPSKKQKRKALNIDSKYG